MTTVAIIGVDGAGKSTVARALEGSMPLRTKYIYMGTTGVQRIGRLVPGRVNDIRFRFGVRPWSP